MWWPVAIAGIVSAFMAWQTLPLGLNLADEGYLWYGVQRTKAGEIPILDFRAYDPGRYWWGAGWSPRRVSLRAVRLATACFGFFGLTCGLLALATETQRPDLLAAAAAVLATWMTPHFKHYEPAAAMITVLALTTWLGHPSAATALAVGAAVGLALVFGLNLGLYAAGAVGLSAALHAAGGDVHSWPTEALAGLAGFVAAGSPVIVLAARNPAFRQAYWRRKVRTLLQRGTTNLRIPVAWPWTRGLEGHFPGVAGIGMMLVGVTLIAFVVVPAGLVVARLTNVADLSPLAIGSSTTALFCAHGTFSRADLPHLSMWIHPLLLTLVAVTIGHAIAFSIAAAFVLVATWTIGRAYQPALHFKGRHNQVNVDVGDTRLRVPPPEGERLAALQAVATAAREHGQQVLALPILCAVYAMGELESPVYDTFPVYPAASETDEALRIEIEKIRPEIVLIDDAAIDGRAELQFTTNYCQTWAFIEGAYEPVHIAGLSPALIVRRLAGLEAP